MTDLEYAMAATEVLEVLKNFKKEDVDKISPNFLIFLETKRLKDYKTNFDFSKPIEELELRASSKAMLGMIYRNYWCNEEEKKEYDKLLRKNSIEHQKILREKFNPDAIFNNKSEIKEKVQEEKIENKEMIEKSETPWYEKVKTFINNLLKRKK